MALYDVKVNDNSTTAANSQADGRFDNKVPVNLGAGSGAGSRGFVNNVNMNGRQVNDQPASGGGGAAVGFTVPVWAWAIVGVIGAVLLLRKK